MDIWSWICELPNSDEWNQSNSQLTFTLASSTPIPNKTNYSSQYQSIQLRAERTSQLEVDDLICFSVYLVGFNDDEKKAVWASDACPLSSETPFLPLVLQLLQEIVSRSPTAQDSTCPRSQLQRLKPEPVSWILDSHSPESFSGFFNLVFLTRLFWICACDAPADVGSFFFRSLLAPNIETFACRHAPVLRNFLVAVGTDVELCFMRTFGYMLAKWLILRDVEVGLRSLTPLPSKNLGFSYAVESHGLWVLKGYAPVKSMQCMQSQGQKCIFPAVIEAKESLLKYALAHQQLEAVIQLEYTVQFHENFIQVNARVDNLRIHVATLGFKKDIVNSDEDNFLNEKHFPSRIRVWVGPEVGASYVGGLSLGRSTDNVEREMEMQKTLKGSSGKLKKAPKVKAMARMATKSKIKNWRWDQDVDGNAAIFDATLCDNTTGVEIATWKPPRGGGGGGEIGLNLRRRYIGNGRPFTKSGGLIFAGEEYGEGVGWRVSKEMEGSVLKWRIGGQVWLSYWPNHVTTSYYETRCIEWCDEVDLPLLPSKITIS
ncbi:hypothetical protein C2S53_008101 [Perilla frutescens var. hirtella]|uniref:Uncharacterized protein n=1 Tax=Perilla frutescens var. hirtella TaxID=608512 RepID=A0AAD4JG07_PERFH|nr:hypothetical protein C2S53_008101 [Perilla frutescens var. hirtella]